MTDTIAAPIGDQRIPFYRRHLPFLAIWLLLVPAGLLILWTGPIYRTRKGVVSTMRRRDKVIFSVLGVLLLLFNVVKLFGGGAGAVEIPTCDASYTTDLLQSAVKNSPLGKQTGLEIQGLKDIHEASWSQAAQIRTCQATAFTNGGSRPVSYKLTWGNRSTGQVYIEVQ